MTFESTLTPKLIYVMRINDSAHAGCLKIGEASIPDGSNVFDLQPNSSILNRAARERIDSYTKTAGINYELIHTETTIYLSGRKVKSFNDKEVHDVLIRSGIHRHKGANFGTEWFETDLETVKNAIRAVREGRKSLLNTETSQGRSPIVLRDEQMEAVKKTKERFKKGNQMLWNAKMRFGKTVSALQTIPPNAYPHPPPGGGRRLVRRLPKNILRPRRLPLRFAKPWRLPDIARSGSE